MSFSRRQLDTLPLHFSEVQLIKDDYMNWRVAQSDIGLKDFSGCMYLETLDGGHSTYMSGT